MSKSNKTKVANKTKTIETNPKDTVVQAEPVEKKNVVAATVDKVKAAVKKVISPKSNTVTVRFKSAYKGTPSGVTTMTTEELQGVPKNKYVIVKD